MLSLRSKYNVTGSAEVLKAPSNSRLIITHQSVARAFASIYMHSPCPASYVLHVTTHEDWRSVHFRYALNAYVTAYDCCRQSSAFTTRMNGSRLLGQ